MTTHLLQSVAATVAHHRPMYYMGPKLEPTADPLKARRFTRIDAENVQRTSAGWMAAVPRPKPRPWGARDA